MTLWAVTVVLYVLPVYGQSESFGKTRGIDRDLKMNDGLKEVQVILHPDTYWTIQDPAVGWVLPLCTALCRRTPFAHGRLFPDYSIRRQAAAGTIPAGLTAMRKNDKI